MHIPDGFLNLATAGSTYLVSAGAVGFSLREANRKLGEKHVPLMGVTAAFIFAAQMLNFPIVGGTSGHLLGAALAAILLGPWAGVLIMSCVLVVQALIFQDGGLTTLGANIFNMGLVASFASYYLYRGIAYIGGGSNKSRLWGGFIAAWASVFLASLAAALELGFSGIVPLRIVLPAMGGIHALIAVGEGLITVAVLRLVMAARKDLMELQRV